MSDRRREGRTMRPFPEHCHQTLTRRACLKLGLGGASAWGLASLRPMAALGQQDRAAGEPPGRIFVQGELVVGVDRRKGIVAVEPGTGTGAMITDGGTPRAR